MAILSTKLVISVVLYLFISKAFTFFTAQGNGLPFTPVVADLRDEECQVTVSQPEELLFGRVNQSVSIPCYFNGSSCSSSFKMLWYVFKKDSHSQLDTNSHSLKYRSEAQYLIIHSLSSDDDGVYYCAITVSDSYNKGAQAFGSGTTVTVKENTSNVGQVLLVTLLVLLMLYSLTVLSFIFCIKKRGSMLLLQRRLRTSQAKSTSTRRVQFGAVVQELYNKRNLRHNNKTPANEALPENKSESPRPRAERESVYQNLHKTG